MVTTSSREEGYLVAMRPSQRAEAAQGVAEIWGWCSTCTRWYFCEGWFDRQARQPRCPVCFTEPTAIENRCATGTQGDPPASYAER